jgi:hypothetical protein
MTNEDIVAALKTAIRQDRSETGDFTGIADSLKRQHDAESEAERWSGRAKRTGNYLKLVIGAATVFAALFGWYTSSVERRVRGQVADEHKAEAAVERVEHVDAEINRLDKSVGEVDDALEGHVDEQRVENQATRARTVRTEVMVEQLLRRRGSKPPKKSKRYKDLQESVGIDPKDPLGAHASEK